MSARDVPPAWPFALAVALLTAGSLSGTHGSAAPGVSATGTQLVTLVLQPDAAAGADAYVLDANPDWNFGDRATILVGRNGTTGAIGRGLVRFDLGSIPSNATIVNATLGLYRSWGGPGTISAARAFAPWTEGLGGTSATRDPILVQETAGVPRVLEPVVVDLTFAPGSIGDPVRDLLVESGGTEVPSQVYRVVTSGGVPVGARIAFGATLAGYASRTYNVTYVVGGGLVPAYRTRTWSSTPLWTFGPTGSGSSGATVVDLDGDARLEIVFGGADGSLYVLNESGGLEWSVSLSASRGIPYTPQVSDMDGDGEMDIVVLVNDPSIVRLNATGGVVWTTPYAIGSIPYSTPTLVDVDGDGVLDVLIGGKMNQVEALSGRNGTVVRTFPAGASTYTSTVVDTDGDGLAEILFGGDDSLVHSYSLNGTERWANAPASASFIESSIAVGDLDGDGVPDAVTGDDTNTGPEFALRATDGAILWSQVLPDYRESGQTLADIDGDGTLEVVVGLQNGEMWALEGGDGTPRWTAPGATARVLTPALVDLDRDGFPEVVHLDEGGLVRVLNRTGAVVHSWAIAPNDPGLRTLSQLPMASPAIADVDGDGTMEVIVPTGTGLQAFATGGLARDWRTWGYAWNHTHRAYDGASPSGAPFLAVTVGPAQVLPAAGVSWDYRDGVIPWAVPGGDFGTPEGSATSATGWMSWNVTSMVTDWHAGSFPNVGLVLTEADEAAGVEHGFLSSDGADPALAPRLTIVYALPSMDPAPRIPSEIPDVVRSEDSTPWTLDLASYASDDDTPSSDLSWNVSGADPDLVAITGMNSPGSHALTFYLMRDAYGTMPVTYWLTDPQGHTARQDAWINVTPVNDAPVFSPPATLTVRYNVSYTFDFLPYLSDPDSPASLLGLSSDDPVGAAVSGFNVTFRYPESRLGHWVFVVLTATDGAANTPRVVAVKVSADFPPVLVRSLPDVTLQEGELRRDVFDLDDYFTDPDNDTLFISVGYTHLTITIHGNHSVDILAEAEWTGQELVTFRGTDPSDALVEDTIRVTVLPINDPPILGAIPDLRVRYDEAYGFRLEPYVSDPDTPLAALNASTSSPYVSVAGLEMTILYPAALNGTTDPVTIFVGDEASVVSRTIRISVGDDRPPILRTPLPDRFFSEDSTLPAAYDLSTFFADPDGPPVFYSSGNVSVLVSIDPSGSVDLSAEANWYGTELVRFRATDPEGALAEDVVVITVVPVNDAPTIAPVPAQTIRQSTAFVDLASYIADVDTNASALVLSSTSPRATAVGLGLILNFTTDGTEIVEFTVSDGLLVTRGSVSITAILPVPSEVIPPYLIWIPLPIVAAGATLFLLYRWRRVEWAILATNSGLVVSSVFHRGSAAFDTDLLTGMLTAIMNFAKTSFSDEKERELEDLVLGDRRVALVRGEISYVAVVYRGRTPGSLPRLMGSLVRQIEARHREALGDLIDSSRLGDVPGMLQRLLKYGWWPFLTFPSAEPRESPETRPGQGK